MLKTIQKIHLVRAVRVQFKTHPKRSVFILFLLLAITGFGISLFAQSDEPVREQMSTTKPAPEPDVIYRSALTGVKVGNEADITAPVTAIMIANSPEARPQSGLKESGVIFESIAEGGVTRFLVLYQAEKPELVGPVRSLRIANVDWIAPFNASIAHVGGSHRALQEVRNGSYRDIDQFFHDGAYWRASDRFAPHNVYTNFQRIDELNKQKGYTASNFTGLERMELDEKPAAGVPPATNISVTMSNPTYNSAYTYDKESNRYLRRQGGRAHIDREKGQIMPSVVIVMKTSVTAVQEDGYRENIRTTGSGEAIIFQNGTILKGKWKKESRSSQLTFTDSSEETIPLASGQTWISVIPQDRGGVTWQK